MHTLCTQCISLSRLQNELLAISALQTPLSHLIPIITTVLNPLLPVATASAGGSALTSRAHGQITLLPRGDWINDYPRPLQPRFCFLGFHFPLGMTKRQGSVCLRTGVTGIFRPLLRVSLPAGVVQPGAASFFGCFTTTPFLPLHTDSSSKSSHGNVHLPVKVFRARSSFSQKGYFCPRIPRAFPWLQQPAGGRLPGQAPPWEGGWVCASRNANLHPCLHCADP